MNNQRQIIRVLIIAGYVLVIFLILFGISKVVSYLNTGADRSKMLHMDLKKVQQYIPEVKWQPLNNEGRAVSKTTVNAIEKDYLDAWYVKNLANQTNEKTGIKDYFTKNARKNIFNNIDFNKTNKTFFESTTLSHHLTFEFFSEDGQLAILSDNNVLEFKRIFKDNKLVGTIKEVNDYKIIFLFEDGFWRIRHLVKTATRPFKEDKKNIKTSITNLKGINYYPQENPWQMYNDAFNIKTIAKDFQIIKKSGLNAIRIFVPYEDFGKAEVESEKINKLKLVLDEAAKTDLKVVLTLFDFYGDYAVINWTLNQKHVSIIVNEFKNHPAIFAWDLKNEPDLDFKNRGEDLVKNWLDYFVYYIKSIDDKHPITIGWSNAKSASILANKVDFVSFHYYEDLEDLSKVYQRLKSTINNRPISITEFGISSYSGVWNGFSSSEQKQASYHQFALEIFKENKIPFFSWTLYDFKSIPKEVVGKLPWRVKPQKEFGFIDQSGNKKPSFEFIAQ